MHFAAAVSHSVVISEVKIGFALRYQAKLERTPHALKVTGWQARQKLFNHRPGIILTGYYGHTREFSRSRMNTLGQFIACRSPGSAVPDSIIGEIKGRGMYKPQNRVPLVNQSDIHSELVCSFDKFLCPIQWIDQPESLLTQLSPLQRRILKLLGIRTANYGQ